MPRKNIISTNSNNIIFEHTMDAVWFKWTTFWHNTGRVTAWYEPVDVQRKMYKRCKGLVRDDGLIFVNSMDCCAAVELAEPPKYVARRTGYYLSGTDVFGDVWSGEIKQQQ